LVFSNFYFEYELHFIGVVYDLTTYEAGDLLKSIPSLYSVK